MYPTVDYQQMIFPMLSRLLIFNFLIGLTCFAFSQDQAKTYLERGDALRRSDASAAYVQYDSASSIALRGADMLSYVRALVGKGYSLRFNRENPNIEGAYQFFFQALNLVMKDNAIPLTVKQELYYGLAITERARSNYDKAMEYGDLAILMANQLDDIKLVSRCYNMLGNIYSDKGNAEEAINHMNKAISTRERNGFRKDEELPYWYYNLGLVTGWEGFPERSNSYLKKALSLFEDFGSRYEGTIQGLVQEIAKNYVDLGDLESARIYFERATQGDKRKFERGARMANHYVLVGDMFNKFNRFDSALYYYQLSIAASISDFEPQTPLDNPQIPETSLSEWLLNPDMYVTIDEKAQLLTKLYKETDSIEYLISAHELYQMSVDLIVRLRSEIDDTDPSLHLAGHAKSVYDNALDVSYQLLSRGESNDELMSSIFNYIEQIKHAILLKYRSNDYAIGDELEFVRGVQVIQKDIDEIQRRISEAQIDQSDGYQEIERSIGRLIALREEKQALTEERTDLFSSEYQTTSLKEVQAYLNDDQLLLNYFWGEEYIYGIAVTRSNSFFKRIDIMELDSALINYTNTVGRLGFVDGEGEFYTFVSSASKLYDKLLAPFLNEIEPGAINEIIVIPDGKISMLPFGALLQGDGAPGIIDYNSLNYLFLDYNVIYGFSASILMLDNSNDEQGDRLVGFSNELLSGTHTELMNIRALWPSDLLLFNDTSSTESNFKSNASSFDIIHIASHATAGEENGQPNIHFYSNEGDHEDGKLFSYEIYPLNLRNKLTVLSACETGLGKHHDGEGVFSVARGFALAGSSTIVTSLWKVRDSQTTQLMSSFYENLNQGMNVKTALHKAKMSYLTNGDAISSHPSMWASFILLGNGDDVILPRRNISQSLFMIVSLLLIVGFTTYFIGVRRKQTLKTS